MADTDDSIKLEPLKQFARIEGHKTIYANASRMDITPWDISISLGQPIVLGDGTQIVEEHVTIIQSPQHAKALLRNLVTTIKAYEENFGPIPEIDHKKIAQAKTKDKAKASSSD